MPTELEEVWLFYILRLLRAANLVMIVGGVSSPWKHADTADRYWSDIAV
jgi:hypothetical protein